MAEKDRTSSSKVPIAELIGFYAGSMQKRVEARAPNYDQRNLSFCRSTTPSATLDSIFRYSRKSCVAVGWPE